MRAAYPFLALALLAGCAGGAYTPAEEVARPLNHYRTVTLDQSLGRVAERLRSYHTWCAALPDLRRKEDGTALMAWTSHTSSGTGYGTPWLVVRFTPRGKRTEAAFYSLYPEGRDWSDAFIEVLEHPGTCRELGVDSSR